MGGRIGGPWRQRDGWGMGMAKREKVVNGLREGMGRNRRRNGVCSGWLDSLAGLGGGIREKERGERRV